MKSPLKNTEPMNSEPRNIGFNNKELEMGIKMEMEHTKSEKVAKKIAIHHLYEYPNYYSSLKKMKMKMKKREMQC